MPGPGPEVERGVSVSLSMTVMFNLTIHILLILIVAHSITLTITDYSTRQRIERSLSIFYILRHFMKIWVSETDKLVNINRYIVLPKPF